MNDKGIETYMRTWGACKDMQTIESYANSPRMSTHVFLYDIVNIFTVPGITRNIPPPFPAVEGKFCTRLEEESILLDGVHIFATM